MNETAIESCVEAADERREDIYLTFSPYRSPNSLPAAGADAQGFFGCPPSGREDTGRGLRGHPEELDRRPGKDEKPQNPSRVFGVRSSRQGRDTDDGPTGYADECLSFFFFLPTHPQPEDRSGCTLFLCRSYSHALIQLMFVVIRGRGGRIAPAILTF